jgi:Zn-dependent M28 family amino/carboxypeptidase
VTPLPVTPTPIPTEAPFGAAARVHLEALANGIGAREPGSAEEARAAAYIASALGDYGYPVGTQRFSFGRGGQHSSANVIAVKAGTSRREIIIGAHYDSVDDGDGADDNASGVGVLLEVAARIRNVATPYTIRLIAFGAEEADDFYGSRQAVSQMDAAQRASVVAMVNLDSLVSGDIPYVYGDDEELVSWVLKAGQAEALDLQAYPVSALHQDSDYFSYQQAGMPFLYFEATNWTLGDRDGFTRVDPRFGDEGEIIHTRYDTLAYLDATFPGRIDGHLARYARVLSLFVTQYGR